jgi:hypothetical protein
MSDLRGPLEHESERFDLAPGALERMLGRRRRLHRRRRMGAVLIILVVAGSGVWSLVSLGRLGKQPSIPGHPATGLEGTWQTGNLSEQDVVSSFVAAGGTAKEGRTFFSQLGGGATHYAVITLRFERGSFVQFESGDGGPPITGYEATYRTSTVGTLTIASPACTGTYSFQIRGRQLRLHVIHQCARHDGPYNSTLFAGFPLTRLG